MSPIFIPNIFNKNPTIGINLVVLHNVVLLGLPHLLADVPPSLCQLEVDEDVVLGKVVVWRQHTSGYHIPGRQGAPVLYTDDEGVLLSLAKRMTGSYVSFRNPHASLELYQSLDHLYVSLTPVVPKLVPEHLVLCKTGNVCPPSGGPGRATDYEVTLKSPLTHFIIIFL